jgi:glycosyltransferase involved in cell wall biosynthesis
MRIGIDVRYLSHGLVGGVHTYVEHFVPALIELAQDCQIYLYADAKRPLELDALPHHVTVRYLPWKNPLWSVYTDFFMGRQVARDRLDVMHYPANYGFGPSNARVVVTLHDAINILPLRMLLRGKGTTRTPRVIAMTIYLHLCSRLALRRAHLLLTVSQHAKNEIVRYSGFDPQRIIPIPHAPTPDLQRAPNPAQLDEVRQRYGLMCPFVLADALKNPAVLVRAWQRLPDELRQARQIVFFSRRPDPLPIVHEAVTAGWARLLILPPRQDLIALYNMAEVFVFPSWIEGFGIPVLEAMTCGAPVIASDRGSIPEVAGDAAILVDAEDDAALAHHLTCLMTVPGQAQQFRQLGYARASQFSWRSTAQQILDGYRKACTL